jgi:hypothetical protein
MALRDLRNRNNNKPGSSWVGANSTWVGRSGNTIAPKAGSQKKTSSGKKVTGGQGGVKSRYSSGAKKNENRQSLLSKVGTRIKNAPDRWRKRLTGESTKPTKPKRNGYAGGALGRGIKR